MQLWSIAAVAATVMAGSANAAEAPADFFKGKSIQLIVGTDAGGVYGAIAQLLQRHLPRYLPGNPAVVPQFTPGAGGVVAANSLYNVAAKDGTAIGALLKDVPIYQVLRPKGVRYDATKFSWLPSWGESVSILTVWHAAPATTIQGAKEKQVLLGAFGKGSGTYQVPAMLNNTIGTKFKIVTGYRGGAAIRLAMERDEVHGWAGFWQAWKQTKPDWVREKKIVHMVQIARKRAADLPDVPLLADLAETEEQRQLFRFVSATGPLANAFSAPPGVPADRLEVLEKGLMQVFRDPAFVKEAQELALDVDPIAGSEVAEIVRQLVSVPPALVESAKKALEME